MTSILLGEGHNGTVRAEQFAVKTYSETEFYIARDAIREASILNHLNDHSVRGVPKLYNTDTVLNNDRTITTSVISLAGRSLYSILSETNDTTERCTIVERHLDAILEVIGEIHYAGVIHNDLNLGNILIDEYGEVTIIDFGLSTFGEVYDIDASLNTPELYRYRRSLYATDYWILAAIILSYCLQIGYIPIQEGTDWSQIMNVLDHRYTMDELYEQEVHASIIIPDAITPSLAVRLRSLLQYNYLDRELDPPPIEFNFSKFKPALDQDYYGAISTTINYMVTVFKGYFMHNNHSRLGVAIDILRRILVPLGGIELNEDVIKSIVLAITSIVFTPERSYIELNRQSTENVSALEVKILSILRWRVLTRTNVQLSDHGDMTMLCNKIMEDKNRYLLMEMSDEELYSYFRD